MPQEAITSPYVDFSYYTESYGGKKLSKDDFGCAEKHAEVVLHQITFDRVKNLSEIPEEVKQAICAMAEVSYREKKKTPGVKSETIDGYSVTYGDSGNTVGSSGVLNMMYQEASTYLANTGLLYRGWSRKYDDKQ